MTDFQKHVEEFTRRGVGLVVASVDTLEEAKKTVERTQLTYAVAYSLDAGQFSSVTGAF